MQYSSDRLHDAKVQIAIWRMFEENSKREVMLPTEHGFCETVEKILSRTGDQP